MKPRERNGVHLGQPVRDLDGKPLGKVVRLWAWGFEARRGLPILSRGRHVLRYDEIRAVRDGALVAARSDRDLAELAAGEIPRTWRIPAPPTFPTAATPSEARSLREDVAAGRLTGAAGRDDGGAEAARAPAAARAGGALTEDEVRAYVRTRGEGPVPPDARSDSQ